MLSYIRDRGSVDFHVDIQNKNKSGKKKMKTLLIMAASCLIIFGTARAFAADDAAGKDRKTDA
jgi:hypothetical protein